MEIQKINSSIASNNSETYHRERKRYEVSSEKIKPIPTKEEVNNMIAEINDFLISRNTSIQYEFHEKLNEYYVKVVDTSTNELIREIPSKNLLDLHAYIKERLGLIIDKKV